MSQMQIEPYLSLMAQKAASDLFFLTGAPASIKVDGVLQPISRKALAPGQAEAIAREMMNEHQPRSSSARPRSTLASRARVWDASA